MNTDICVKDFSATTAPRILKFVTNLVSYKRESASSCLSFPLFVHFSFSPIKLFVQDFSGTTAPRILKFRTNIGYNLLYCVRDSAISCLSFLCPFFFSSNKIFLHWLISFYDSHNLWELWVWLIVSCKRHSASSCLSFPLLVHFYFSLIKFFFRFLRNYCT